MDHIFGARLSMTDYESHGAVKVDGERLSGKVGAYRLRGVLFARKDRVIAIVDAVTENSQGTSRHLVHEAELLMSGHSHGTGFDLIGTGPLGVIVELQCMLLESAYPGPLPIVPKYKNIPACNSAVFATTY